MAVRETEKKLPAGVTASQLGQAAVSATNAQVFLISYLSSPIVVDRKQNYVVFVTDPALIPTVAKYKWTLKINDFDFENNTEETTIGLFEFIPKLEGKLVIKVELKNAGGTVLASVELKQSIISPNAMVEQLIETGTGPTGGDPDTTKEIFNDLKCYIDDVVPLNPNNLLLNKLISSIAYLSTLKNNKSKRNTQNEALAKLINDGKFKDFYDKAKTDGIGVCAIRPQIFCMFLPSGASTVITLTKLSEDATSKDKELETIKTSFNKLLDPPKIDIFNRLRFPKSNIAACLLILQGLKKEYYNSTDFKDLLKSANKDKAKEVLTHFEIGPLKT